MGAAHQLLDPSDGLPAGQCRDWASAKHETLRRYIQITSSVRRKYIDRAGAGYIDLFAGAGRARNGDSGDFQDGSPLVAWNQALESGVPFSQVVVNDADPLLAGAVQNRLLSAGAPVVGFSQDVEAAATAAVELLNPYGFHIAFLDPYDLGIPFQAISTLLKLRRVDLLLHVSAMDLQRNLPKVRTDEGIRRKLDAFAPGWENAVKVGAPPASQREQLLQHWMRLVAEVGTEAATFWKLICNSKNAPLYWLVLVARHRLAHDLWDKLHSMEIQPPLL